MFLLVEFFFFSASWILCSFNLNLTLFSLLMFKAVMIGCDKRDISLHPQKKSDGLSDSCLLPLVMLHSHHVILFLIAFCYVHDVFSSSSFFFFTGNVKLIFHKPTAVSVNEIITYSFGLNCDLIALITSLSHT